jgi:ABC-type uncharacterized transport system substrate-binding protein
MRVNRLLVLLILFGFSTPAEAQQPQKVSRVGLLLPCSASTAVPWEQAFRQGLRDLGWVEGKNIRIDSRYSEGRDARLADLAGELVRLKAEVIVTSITPDTLAAKNATREIPIVMASVGDPVGRDTTRGQVWGWIIAAAIFSIRSLNFLFLVICKPTARQFQLTVA